jgi:microcystin-dependent protein
MADYFVGEIRVFPYHFVPQDFMACNGQLLPMYQFQMLYAVIGTTYGGNPSQQTFQLPNLNQGQTSMALLGAGQGPGLSNYPLGGVCGADGITLTESRMPPHQHTLTAINAAPPPDTYPEPIASTSHLSRLYDSSSNINFAYSDQAATTSLAATALSPAGLGQPHENRQPFLGFIFAIATDGVFPQRP